MRPNIVSPLLMFLMLHGTSVKHQAPDVFRYGLVGTSGALGKALTVSWCRCETCQRPSIEIYILKIARFKYENDNCIASIDVSNVVWHKC